MLRTLAIERSRWSLAFATIVTVLVGLAAIMLRNTYALRERERWVTHSYEVIQELESMTGWCSRLLIKARQQLTDNVSSAQAEPLAQLGMLTETASKIQSLVSDNVDQRRIAAELATLTDQLQQTLNGLQSAKVATADDVTTALGPSDTILSQILDLMSMMRANEEKLLRIRTRDSRAIFWSSLASQFGTTLFALAAAFSSLYLAQQRYRAQVTLVENKMRQDEQSRLTAEAANQAKSNFLANMSHELRTPLNAVIMYSEMLQEEAAEMNASHFAKDLARIHSAGRHLLALVNGVLDIAKIEAGKMDLHIETVSIQPTISNVIDTIKSLIDKNKNRLDVQVNIDGTMRQDVTKFRQILFNLLSNAAKFTHEGTITLKVSAHTKISAKATEGEYLTIEVVDTGLGIPAERLDDLFKPFVQAEKSTSKEYGGTGLGLTITKQFTELMGGTIQVASELGKGTTFALQLPRYQDEGVREKGESSQTEVKQPHVLIIDDDPNSCEFVARALASDGISTLTAHDGSSGLRLAQEFRPRLIVLDVLMPKMDGWNVLAQLKANAVTADIPVVLLTIASQSELGFSLGAALYLGKPVTREQLISVAHRLGLTDERRAALVVDDDAATREVLERMLSREGWRVQTAGDGQVALSMLQSGVSQPDMILLDLQMPNMDGFDFIAALQQGSMTTKASVVVLTSRDLTVEEKSWLADRVERILQKGGQTHDSLLKTLREIIKHAADVAAAVH